MFYHNNKSSQSNVSATTTRVPVGKRQKKKSLAKASRTLPASLSSRNNVIQNSQFPAYHLTGASIPACNGIYIASSLKNGAKAYHKYINPQSSNDDVEAKTPMFISLEIVGEQLGWIIGFLINCHVSPPRCCISVSKK